MIYTKQKWQIGDCVKLMREIPDESIDTIITSPPYWGLRDYGVDGQIGLEETLKEYHARLLEVTAECMRVLKLTGVMFWNHGDSYGRSGQGSQTGYGDKKRQRVIGTMKEAVSKSISPKCMLMQNERLIIRMIDDQGWILRNRIIWNKPNGMPSSMTDRFTNKYEPVYMLVKSKKYYFDLAAVRVPVTNAVRYQIALRANKKYRDGAPHKANTSYRHNIARRTSQESPNRVWGDVESLERQIAAGKNPGDVSELTKEEWLDHCEHLWNIFTTEPGDLMRIPTQPYSESHFATFPTALIEPMIKAGCPAEICPVCGLARTRVTDTRVEFTSGSGKAGVPKGKCDCGKPFVAGTVLDPFCGSGTVLEVCRLLNRNAIGLELNPEYEPMIRERSMSHTPPLTSYVETE